MSLTGSAGDACVEVRGERLVLLPERAAYWEGAATLLVADAHFGKAAAFRAAGVPVPGGTTADAVARLDGALERTGARRVVFLGDLFHARQGQVEATLDALRAWRWRRLDTEVLLVRGNHDRRSGDPPPELGIDCADPPRVEMPFELEHHPRPPVAGGYVLAGHLHPAVRLVGRGRQRERLPCFLFGREGGILPAFGDFTGAAEVSPGPGDRVFVVAGDAVVPVG